ncbi:MAG: hypothetical protein KAI57_00970 [Candidatus Pacebacteria bacterium]|nr:hypothetical protein [Candidatus Paceibacterota bacterium]
MAKTNNKMKMHIAVWIMMNLYVLEDFTEAIEISIIKKVLAKAGYCNEEVSEIIEILKNNKFISISDEFVAITENGISFWNSKKFLINIRNIINKG